MKASIEKIRNRLNNLSDDELIYIDKLFSQRSNIPVKIACFSKFKDLLERLDEIKKLHSNHMNKKY